MRNRCSLRIVKYAGLIIFVAALLFPPTVKADGLPGEYSLTSRWRMQHVPYSPLGNPAILTEANYPTARLAFSTTLGEFLMSETGFTMPLGLYQSVGATWLMLGTGAYDGTQWNNGQITVGGRISDNSNLLVLSYAINPWKRLSIGANINVVHHALFNNQSQIAIGADVGLTYRVLRHQVVGDHMFGVGVQNLLPPRMNKEESYATNLRVSLLSHYWESRIISSFEYNYKDFLSSENDFSIVNGLPGVKKMEWDFNASVGGWLLRAITFNGMVGFAPGGVEHWGFSGGLNLPSLNAGRDLAFAYQYLMTTDENAVSHTWYARTEIGKHREEIYARNMARKASLAPNELYNKALELYYAKNYWDAYFVFTRLAVDYPDFFKNDWVNFYMASCQEKLDMREAGLSQYQKTADNFKRSIVVPFAMLGTMRIYYRDASYAKVAETFEKLNRPSVPDSLKNHAYYIMAQAHIAQKEFDLAAQLLELVPEAHPDFVFAQHSLAILNVIGNDVGAAIGNLESSLQAEAPTTEQKEIVNRSFVILGYLLYEHSNEFEGGLAKAVTALRNVQAESPYYEDAQLGLGWVALKAHQWQDCLTAGDILGRVATSDVLKAEAALLRAYAYLMQKNYSQTIAILTEAADVLEKHTPLSGGVAAGEKQNYDTRRSEYREIATTMQRLASARQGTEVVTEINGLSVRQKDVKANIDAFIRLGDANKRLRLFERNLATVKEDIQYALATAQKISGMKGTINVQQKVQKQQQEIDQEIEKLKGEMQKLQQNQ
jgi:tetratricopeptide (TPR) repeat protein